jgi:undecaprenyl-diphosphatase
MIDIWLLVKAVVLGLVEGATEFIPVSSTGHLIVASEWLNWTDERANTFIIFIQLPAILAVIWLYRKKIGDVVTTLGTSEQSRRLAINLVIAMLPAVVIGLPTEELVEQYMFGVLPVAIALVVGGILIFLIERGHREERVRVQGVDDIPYRLAIAIGCFQVLAMVFPGVSRSGATILGGLVIGLSRLAATEFSFFLAIPAMVGATALKLFKARDLLSAADIPVFAVGGLVSFLSALYVIRALLSFVSRNTFIPFAWYRVGFGLLLLILYWQGFGVG